MRSRKIPDRCNICGIRLNSVDTMSHKMCNICYGIQYVMSTMEIKGMSVLEVRLAEVKGCHSCPHVKDERTPNAGYAFDFWCGITGSKIAGYVEWDSEKAPRRRLPIGLPTRDQKIACAPGRRQGARTVKHLTEEEFSAAVPTEMKQRVKSRLKDMHDLVESNQYSGLLYFCQKIIDDLEKVANTKSADHRR